MSEVPRAEWPKLGVFLHPEVLKKLEKRTAKEGFRSMTRYVEALILRDLDEPTGNIKRKAS